jgi:hypothetical protein
MVSRHRMRMRPRVRKTIEIICLRVRGQVTLVSLGKAAPCVPRRSSKQVDRCRYLLDALGTRKPEF